ncbi:Cdc7p-Dbf4p kinase complex regulatory subunit [Rhizina undulata]
MAQVSIPPSPAAMSRRAPLSNLPNAVNSHYQSLTATVKRSHPPSVAAQRDAAAYDNPPATKKQIFEAAPPPPAARTPVRSRHVDADPKPAKKGNGRARAAAPPAHATAQQQQVQRKASASNSTKPVAAVNDAPHQNIDTVRQWQRHYRKVFPSYVFYFENIPDDIAYNCKKLIVSLGARIEKFFSSEVTHVITTRQIPPENQSTVSKSQMQTINPLLLERGGEAKVECSLKSSRKYSITTRASQEDSRDGDFRKNSRAVNDILLKAREYGIKTWALEKLQRIMNTLFDVPADQPVPSRSVHPTMQGVVTNDLTQLLRHEKLHGPTDRDPNVASKDQIYFKGPFVYIRDMLNTHRPVMVRDYQKVSRKEDGQWPQFRSVSGSKCPFVEEAEHQRRERDREKYERMKEREREREKEAEAAKARIARMQPPVENQKHKSKKTLTEINRGEARLNTTKTSGKTAQFQPPPPVVAPKRGKNYPNNDIAFTATASNQATQQTNFRGNEPIASGVQPSNITSAIRSQAVSSHTDQPGQRAGTSKELFDLKRKVLINPAVATRGSSNSQRVIDLTATSEKSIPKNNKRKLGADRDAATQQEERQVVRERKIISKEVAVARKVAVPVKREARPGYCENCREKFDDFDEHTVSRRHRRFALNDDNWAELDDLLNQLTRPLRRPASKYVV